MQVLCVITGLGSVDVTVDENATVATVKEALKRKETTALVNVEAQRLQLFLAKRDGQWLSLDSREITLMYRDLSPLEDLVQQELGADEAVLDMVQPLQPWGTVHFLAMLPTRSIMYLIVGFPGATRMVNVDHDAKISVLTEMLLQDERLPNNEHITLFLAKRNNSWLEYDSKDEAMLALGDVTTNVKGMLTTKAINPDASVDQVFGALPAQRCVHVLVVVPGHKLRGALPGLLGEYKVQMHWDEMNYAFARLKPSANESANLHRITWNDIGHFYTQKEYEEEALQVSDQCFCHVKTKLGQAISTIGGVCSNIEISWVLFTLFASILAAEKTRMKGIKVFGKYPIDNPDGRLSVGGDLDFAITSKTHCVCLMESQRAAQNVQEMKSSDYDTEISSDSSEDDGAFSLG